MNKEAVAKRLATSKELIQKHGWLRGSYGSTKTGYCMIGALQDAEEIVSKKATDMFGEEFDMAEGLLAKSCCELLGDIRRSDASNTVVCANDRVVTSVDQIYKIFDLAIQKANL